jgi:hypothetical protein
MNLYKRNQVEDAIGIAMGIRSDKEAAEFQTRVKRLLDADRAFGRNKRSNDPGRSNYAFYSEESPGKGSEINFSEYEAFAVMTALRMLTHNWPQGFAVSTLRRIRPELERHHSRILTADPRQLFSHQQDTSPGTMVQTNSRPEFLLIVSDDRKRESVDSSGAYARLFRDEQSAFRFQLERPGRTCSWFELVTAAFELHQSLQKTEPRKRGRSS